MNYLSWAPCSCCNEISILMIAEVILFLLVSNVPIWKHWHFQGIHLLHINLILIRNAPMLQISCLMTKFLIYLSEIFGSLFICCGWHLMCKSNFIFLNEQVILLFDHIMFPFLYMMFSNLWYISIFISVWEYLFYDLYML